MDYLRLFLRWISGTVIVCLLCAWGLLFATPAMAASETDASAMAASATAADIQWDCSITADFTYFHVQDDYLFLKNSGNVNNLGLQLGLSGLIGSFQYDIRTSAQGNPPDPYGININGPPDTGKFKLEQATLSGMAGVAVFEIGKKDWNWGKGFTFSPTYPLISNQSVLGGEGTWTSQSLSVAAGAAFTENDNDLKAGWLRIGYLFENSDITAVLSYSNPNLTDNYNFGVEYSYDFLNGLVCHGEINVSSPNNYLQYLLGGLWITKSGNSLLFEYYHNQETTDNYLVFVFGKGSTFAGNWNYELDEILDLNDGGLISQFNLKYVRFDQVTPELIIKGISGPAGSKILTNPTDYEIAVKMTIKLN